MDEKPVLVIGGTERTGGRVNSRLRARGITTQPRMAPGIAQPLDRPARVSSDFARSAASDGVRRKR